MIRTSRYTSYHRNGTNTYHVVIEQWTAWKYWRARLYHRYDMWFPVRVPGFRRLVKRLGGETMKGNPFVEGPERFVRIRAWVVEQDLRCYYYMDQGECLVDVEVTKEVYDAL
jgi:hypothetical protein